MNKETLRMQMLAGIITEGQYKDGLNEEEYNLYREFSNSPEEHQYEDVLNIIESYEEENILDNFKSTFPPGKPIKKQDYVKFAESWMDDLSELEYVKANWVSITDDEVFEKAGIV